MEATHALRQDVLASIWFLKESEVYATIKPYSLAFTPEAQIPRENIERQEVSVSISDLRDNESSFSLDRNGFVVLDFQEQYDKVDWENETSVKAVHYPYVQLEVQHALPGSRCTALHHQVSIKPSGTWLWLFHSPSLRSANDILCSLSQPEKTTPLANPSGQPMWVSYQIIARIHYRD